MRGLISRCGIDTFVEQRTGLATPSKQLLGAQPVAPCHLRTVGPRLQALHHDACLVGARPSPAPAAARDQLDPPHLRDAAIGPVPVAFKLMLKRNVKIIAHGKELSRRHSSSEMWGGYPAYATSIRGLPRWVFGLSSSLCATARP